MHFVSDSQDSDNWRWRWIWWSPIWQRLNFKYFNNWSSSFYNLPYYKIDIDYICENTTFFFFFFLMDKEMIFHLDSCSWVTWCYDLSHTIYIYRYIIRCIDTLVLSWFLLIPIENTNEHSYMSIFEEKKRSKRTCARILFHFSNSINQNESLFLGSRLDFLLPSILLVQSVIYLQLIEDHHHQYHWFFIFIFWLVIEWHDTWYSYQIIDIRFDVVTLNRFNMRF